MGRLVLRGVRARPLGSALTAAALATVFAGLLGLVRLAEGNVAQLRGRIDASWRTTFDLLVRPQSAPSATELARGLVRPNYLGGVTGGITEEQLRAIRRLPLVSVAAPVAIVGYAEWPGSIRVVRAPPRRGIVEWRLDVRARAEADMSRFRIGSARLIVASRGVVATRLERRHTVTTLIAGRRRIGCATYEHPRLPTCWAPHQSLTDPSGRTTTERIADPPLLEVPFRLPVLVAGIDPAAERRLSHVDRCVTTGRYLSDRALHGAVLHNPDLVVPVISGDFATIRVTDIPLLASDRTFLDEKLVSRLQQRALAAGAPAGWRGTQLRAASPDAIYRRYLRTLGHRLLGNGTLLAPGDVTYTAVRGGALAAEAEPADLAPYANLVFGRQGAGRRYAPAEAHDLAFRLLAARELNLHQRRFDRWRLEGRYDPACLPGFGRYTGARLDIAAPPEVRLPDGRELGPTRSVAGYVNSPP